MAATASRGVRAQALTCSARLASFLLALLWAHQGAPCGAQVGQLLARSSAELAAAFANQTVSVIYLNDTITVDGSWSDTIAVTRNVTVRATEEREAEGVYCLLDFNMRVMLLSLAAGCTLEFRGIELVNHLSEVGPNVKPVRQSVGATILVNNSVQRRRAGLPLAAGLVNLLAGPRPEGMPGPQSAYIVQNFTFRSTRSTSPLQYGDAANMVDYRAALPPDSSLAFQGLYYGGYIYMTNYSWYVVDHYVPDSCLQQRSGSECVTLLLAQLDKASSPPPAPGARGGTTGGSSSSNTTTVVVAVVVPVCSVLLLSVLTALLLVRRRRRRQQADRYGPGAKQPDGSDVGSAGKGDVEAGSGAGSDPRVRAAEQGCVFMGLDEDQDLPPWSGMEEHADASVGNGNYFPSMSRNGIGGVGGGSAAHPSWLSGAEGRVGALEDRMAEINGKLTPGSGGASNGKAAAGDGAAGGGGSDSGGGTGLPTALATAAGTSGAYMSASASGERLQPVLASLMAQEQSQGQGQGADTPSATPEGSDAMPRKAGVRATLPQELEEMSKGLRTRIKDVQLRLDGVLGTGAYGTVYSGTWQGLPVAVKTLVFSASTENRRRALQEAALSQSVTHPNIVASYMADVEPLGAIASAAGSTGQAGSGNNSSDNAKILQDWRLYIVQEFCDGGPLRTLYGDKSLWPAPGANMVASVSLALGIANALAHLHSKRIVHGDLNPNNVLLKRDPTAPSGYTVKVGDFGLSVMLPNQQTHISNMRMGTMFYMCPTVVLKAQVGPNSDIFSLGVMLWELYHGRPAGTHTRHGPRYSSAFPSFPPTCHPAYRALALHCLQRQPQNRPTAQAVAEALAGLLEVLLAERGLVPHTPHSAVPSPLAPMQGSGTEQQQQ